LTIFEQNLPPLTPAFPFVLDQAAVSSGTSHTTFNRSPGHDFLIQGIDVYATVQPNNGSFNMSYESTGTTILLIQQSANFPGPYYWRGTLPLPGLQNLFTTATVPFVFSIWGVFVPTYHADYNPEF
jgi:hypothetical protein